MSKLELNFEWQDPGGVNAPELRATWASLAVRVDDQAVTHIASQHERAVREHIYVSLYPLAEWLTRSWFVLFHESGSPTRIDRHFRLRHDLRAAAEGFAWPALRLYGGDAFVQLVWKQYKHEPSGIEFLSSGDAHVHRASAEQAIFDLISSVVARLDESGVSATPLQQDWQFIQSLDTEEREFCRTVSQLGLDCFNLDATLADRIISSFERLDSGVAEDVLALVNINNIEQTVSWFEHGRTVLHERGQQMFGIDRLRNAITKLPTLRSGGIKPWTYGYDAARQFRESLGVGPDRPVDLSDVFGIDDDDNDALVIAGPDLKGLEALIEPQQDSAYVGLLQSRPGAQKLLRRKFDICRAGLGAVLSQPGSMSVVAETYSAQQKAARAFAAEFLAPAEGIKLKIDAAEVVSDADVEDIADFFAVTPAVISHQIENHGFARVMNPS
jgi:hypothetical protein